MRLELQNVPLSTAVSRIFKDYLRTYKCYVTITYVSTDLDKTMGATGSKLCYLYLIIDCKNIYTKIFLLRYETSFYFFY